MNRRMMLASAALLLAPLAAQAQTRDVSVTIYNSNLALVEDARPLDLKAGRQKLEFKDVSAAIRPETVSLSAPGVTILEQNFDYDLLTPDKLMEKADYVALFDEAKSTMDLQGWITLSNNSGTPFENARTQLVAGDVNQLNDGGYRSSRSPGMISAGTESGVGERVADYYVYPLPERTTIASNQNKQVGFLSAQGVTAKKVYEVREGWFTSQAEPTKAVVAIQFSNARLAGLGAQLPMGTMRVYMRDAAGDPKFVGENAIGHTPAGSELSIKTGEAFDVSGQATLVAESRVSKRLTRYEMKYLLRNAKDQPVTVELRQGGLGRDSTVKAESLKGRRIDAGTLGWSVPVPANGETVLTFTVETGW